jgi:hypothetical protein
MSLADLCSEFIRQDVVFIDTPWVWSLRWNPTRVPTGVADRASSLPRDDAKRDDGKTRTKTGRWSGKRKKSD